MIPFLFPFLFRALHGDVWFLSWEICWGPLAGAAEDHSVKPAQHTLRCLWALGTSYGGADERALD